jgi:hypothetical protein
MSFFYDLNKKLDSIRATPEVTHKQLNERDMGKHNNGKTTGFKAVADKAAKEYGSKAAGERVAGAQFQKMKKAGQLEEGPLDAVKQIGKKVAGGINKLVGHGSDEDMIKDLQSRSGAPVTGKKPSAAPKQTPIDPKDEYDYFTGRDKVRGGEQQQKKPNLPEMDSSDAASDAREAMAKQIHDLSMSIHRNDRMYATDSPQEKAKLKQLEAEFARLYPGEDGFKVGSGFYNSEYERAQRQKQSQPAAPKPTGIMQKAKNAVSGMFKEDDMPMTAKQKSFAKLAPPADKITFADKIAGAKKEVDEMLGDVAAEAMRSALGGGKGRNAEMDEENAFTAHKRPAVTTPKVGSTERGHKHDIKHTATGRMVTRRVDDQGNSVGADDDSAASGEKRGRGRPKGTKQSIGAKGPSGRSKLMTKESDVDVTDQGEYDQEGDMAKDDIKTIVRHAQALSKVLGDNDNLPEWVQSKLAKIEGMMISIDEYMQNQAGDDDSEEPIAEKAVSKQQQKFMGMAHAMQKGEKVKGASKELKKVAKTMKPKDTEDFAKTKHKGLPDKVKSKKKEEEVDESTTSGLVATSTATTGSKGGVFGKGIYDSMNRELEKMISESMSINMSDSTEGNKSLTVTATDDDAMKLAMILKSAGLGGGDAHGSDMHSHDEEACDTCGMQDCGCGDVQEAVDENAPDWPTNTETSPDALQYSGGLNKPKTDVAGDGQTTIPNTAVHTQDEDALRRMMEMAGIKQADLEPWERTMKEGDLDEAYVVNPNHPSVSDDEYHRLNKAWDDEYNLYGADNPADDPGGKLRRKGFNRAQEVGQRLAWKLQKLRNYPELREPGLGVGESLEEDDGFAESIQRMREIAGIHEAKKDLADKDYDGDGTLETGAEEHAGSVDKAIKKSQEEKKVDESIFALTNQWKAYKG